MEKYGGSGNRIATVLFYVSFSSVILISKYIIMVNFSRSIADPKRSCHYMNVVHCSNHNLEYHILYIHSPKKLPLSLRKQAIGLQL